MDGKEACFAGAEIRLRAGRSLACDDDGLGARVGGVGGRKGGEMQDEACRTRKGWDWGRGLAVQTGYKVYGHGEGPKEVLRCDIIRQRNDGAGLRVTGDVAGDYDSR